MRRLIPVNSKSESERGAVAVVVAVLALVLLGVGAIAVDVGMVYSERAQLQNAADAGALAVAARCAEDDGCPAFVSSLDTAQTLANGNSLDKKSNVDNVDTSEVGKVKVWTSVRQSDDSSSLSLGLAKAIGIETMNVAAYAVASWGGPKVGPAAWPMAFNPCQFDLSGTEQAILTQGSGVSCVSDNPSGGSIPGGFEWVDPESGKCEATVHPDDPDTTTEDDAYMSSKTGASMPKECKSVFDASLGTVILFPVWESNTGTGTGSKYYIKGYAAFHVTGYLFPGASGGNTDLIIDSSGKKSNGIQGFFVEFVADPSEYSGGGYTGGGVTLPPILVK